MDVAFLNTILSLIHILNPLQGVWHGFSVSADASNSARWIVLDDRWASKWSVHLQISLCASCSQPLLSWAFSANRSKWAQFLAGRHWLPWRLFSPISWKKSKHSLFRSFVAHIRLVLFTFEFVEEPRNCSLTIDVMFVFLLYIVQPGGRSQRIDFSSHPNIVAYIPHVSLYTLPYPLLTCNVDNIDKVRKNIWTTN